MWRKKNDLSDEQLRGEYVPFKQFSGKYQCKVLGNNNATGYTYLLGSGGFLNYRGRYFLVTNEHVARKEPINAIVVFAVSKGRDLVKLIDLKVDKERDIAVYEIDANCVALFRGKEFLTDNFIKRNPEVYLVEHNPVFLHATPVDQAEIEYEKYEVSLTTFQYLTFAKGYTNDFFLLDINAEGENELGKIVDVPVVSGMSGSWAYCHTDNSLFPYQCIGILCNGETNSGSLWVLNIDMVLQFIENQFFV